MGAASGQRAPRGALYGMPLRISRDAPTVLVKRASWERSGIARAEVDRRFGLTADEFRVEGSLVAIGPLFEDAHLGQLIELLEGAGLVQYDDFFELSGNWPEWLTLLVLGG